MYLQFKKNWKFTSLICVAINLCWATIKIEQELR